MNIQAIVLQNANDPDFVEVVQNAAGENRVFLSADDAADWVENNAQVGWVTKIIEID